MHRGEVVHAVRNITAVQIDFLLPPPADFEDRVIGRSFRRFLAADIYAFIELAGANITFKKQTASD